MLERLEDIVRNRIPELLDKREVWDSLIVNRRKPYTYRVHTKVDGLRVCLHKFDVCHDHESYRHPHPWAGAFLVLQGKYKMNMWLSSDREDMNPREVAPFILSKHSSYAITNPLTWHSVTPLKETYTIMVNDTPWDKATVAHIAAPTTTGKDLDKMPENELLDHLQMFKMLVQSYNRGIS